MKSFLIAFALCTMVSARAQTLQWSSTNNLPTSFSNSILSVSAGVDGAGGSAWLVNGSIGPFSGFSTAQHLIYLDRSGNLLMTIGVGSNGMTSTSASLVRVARNEVVVDIRGAVLSPAPTSVHFLRRYEIGKNVIGFTDTAVELNETFAPPAPVGSVALTDKTGFFSYTLGTPQFPTIMMRRYSNK